MPVYEYDQPDRFVAGTVGEPGQRTFFLQASATGRVTSVALEKTQVAVLAERIDDLLDDVVRRSGGEAAVPAIAPTTLMDTGPLATPVEEDFRVGTMSLAWDGEQERVVIECLEVGEEATTEGDLTPAAGASLLRVTLTGAADGLGSGLAALLSRAEVRRTVERVHALIDSGRFPLPSAHGPAIPWPPW